jgi:acyl-CoA synthetase (AMP-forming)/AMP-acid ligase II
MVRIASESGDHLIDDLGEIVISGPNVTPGYESNPDANAKSFFEAEGHRWFRTGDQGHLDAEGYLWLTGRLKEIINRGGEKISPREVDEVLMDHPAVAQAVTFALPHAKLGEDVAAAVVLRDGADIEVAEIRKFTQERLAAFKVPRKILILDEIPKGATGKLQRIGLHEKLGLAESA